MSERKRVIRAFDPSSIPPGSVIVLIGRRNTGKSVVARDLLVEIGKKAPMGVVINDTEELNQTYSGMVPGAYLYAEADKGVVERMILAQRTRQTKMPNWSEKPYGSRCFLVIDDCGFDREFMTSRALNQLFSNGRHLNITIMVVVQDLMQLTKAQRAQVDYVVGTSLPAHDRQRDMYSQFGHMFDTQDSFRKVFKACTQGYSCMVLYTQGDDSGNKVFHYTARPPSVTSAIRVGNPRWWKDCRRPYTRGVAHVDAAAEEDSSIIVMA